MKRIAMIAGLLMCLGLLAACLPQTSEEPQVTEELIVPTAVPQISEEEVSSDAVFTPLPVVPTFVVPTETPEPNADEGVALPAVGPPRYEVAYVLPDDVLNVRTGPGVEFEVVGEFAPDLADIEITGPGQEVDGSTWVPVIADETSGWVNGRFLAQTLNERRFCQDDAVESLLQSFESALASEEGTALAELIHPERGLRIRLAWWNPEILVGGDEVIELLSSDVAYEWGIEDGSGNEINGTFADIVFPLLQDDLLQAEETGCNEIVHGGTAGWVRLPDGYEAINFYSFYRPGSEEVSSLDWGTWVVGIEKWQGDYYISFLTHYQWEI